MRIVYLHQYFVTPEMSGGTRSYEMARRWVAAGHDVHMVTSDTSGSSEQSQTVEAGIKVTWIPVEYSNRMGKFARIRAFLEFAIRSSRAASYIDGDVVFATSTPLTIAIPAIYAKWRRRIPMVFEVRDLWPETPIALGVIRDPISRFLARRLERLAYRFSDHIVALSDDMKRGVTATGCPENRITVVPNAADNDLFPGPDTAGEAVRSRYGWLGDRPLVVYAGTLGYANDVGYMVRLAHEVYRIDPEIRFATFGAGKEEEKIRELARQIGVLGLNFFMLERVPKKDLPSVLSAATVGTSWVRNVPAMQANSANKFFDTLAAGRPIVINHLGWQADVIRDEGVGEVLSATDVPAAARLLVSRLRDETWLRETSRRAGDLARSRYDRDRLSTEVLGILTSQLATHVRRIDDR